MTGREWALALAERYQGTDWMGELARRSGEPRDKVEWHLQEEMEPPPAIAQAAESLLADKPAGNLPRGDLNADDLPFSGVPEFMGRLHKD